jgi:outer membrane biosynthesis protein TonB
LTEVQFEGIINSFSGGSIVVGGQTVLINNNTRITGNPEVGRLAQVAADQMADGRLIGKVIVVLDAPATPTPTATQQPTATPTDTPEPTSTPTSEPTPTDTPEPTSTPTSEPTPTDTPEPTSASTPEPASTPAPEPTP